MKCTSSVNYPASSELDVLTYLQPRMNLSPADKMKYHNLYKGLEGERQLHKLFNKQLPSSFHVLTDLLLAYNETEFQVDILLIADDTMYPLEVKNYEGNFIIQNDRWYAVSTRKEIRNPLHQLNRMEISLKNLLHEGKFKFSIEPHIIFPHPEFYLYQVPLDLPLVFPTQLIQFIRKLQATSFRQTTHQENLVRFLEGQRKNRSAHQRLPEYEYEDLKKGIVCRGCSKFMTYFTSRALICRACENKENIETALIRNVREFITLFPDRRITTNAMYDWSHIIKSKKAIRRILKKHLTAVGTGRQTYYVVRK